MDAFQSKPPQSKPTTLDVDLSQHALLTGLATNLYLTALALCLSNRLVATADTALITAIARSAPPEVEARENVAMALSTIGLSAQATVMCAAALELQARARRELEHPSGPHRFFRPASNSYIALQRLWQSAAENGLFVLTSVLDSDMPSKLTETHLRAAHGKLRDAIDGTLAPTDEEMAGVLPGWIRRRRHVRRAVSLPVTLWARDSRERGQALDVSQGGALVVMRGASSRGDKLRIEFPGRALMTAIVQWRLDTRTGVKFVEPLDATDPLLIRTAPSRSAF